MAGKAACTQSWCTGTGRRCSGVLNSSHWMGGGNPAKSIWWRVPEAPAVRDTEAPATGVDWHGGVAGWWSPPGPPNATGDPHQTCYQCHYKTRCVKPCLASSTPSVSKPYVRRRLWPANQGHDRTVLKDFGMLFIPPPWTDR